MKLKMLTLTALAGIALTACTSAPKIPQLETGVLQEVHNLDVYPETTDNKARLIKFPGKCIIEFTGNLEAAKSVEQWSFNGLTLISGGTATFAKDGSSKASNFDLQSPDVQKNFLILRNHFHKDALAQCD